MLALAHWWAYRCTLLHIALDVSPVSVLLYPRGGVGMAEQKLPLPLGHGVGLPVPRLLATLSYGHGTEAKPGALLVKLLHLLGLPLMEQPHSLLSLLPKLGTLLLHLLAKQSPPHTHPLL